MSLFDFPRINFAGTIQLNPGTANNDDYAQQPGALVIPDTFDPPYAGQVFGLMDSKNVQARTFGMTDAQFIDWVQNIQTFGIYKSPGQTTQQIPAEWNYYGGMDSQDASITVVGVQSPGVDSSALIGMALGYSGTITDVNSEGSPPATQFFIDSLTLPKGASQPLLSGPASKGAAQWLNFYRNVNLQADGGAGGYVYHVIRKGGGTTINLPGFDDDKIAGVICRYYLYRFQPKVSKQADIVALYQQQQSNPTTLQIVGTIAPLLHGEEIVTGPVGRLLVSNDCNVQTPPDSHNNSVINNNKGLIALAPAVLRCDGKTISADFSGTFPDYFKNGANPKYDFGAVTLNVSGAGGSALIGPVDYADGDAGDRRGWIFDFDIASNEKAQQILKDPEAKFTLQDAQNNIVLAETDYYFVSNQQGIYAEQHGPCDIFLNQGTTEPATISVYHRGRELGPAECPPISVWQYRSVPIQCPGNVETLSTNFKPGQHLQVDTSQPGNFLFTFGIDAPAGYPPTSYNTFMLPPYITNAPSISLRILPNEDYSQYYKNPKDPAPVGNEKLTFKVVYQNVLQTYYLLYPVMNFLALNNATQVSASAKDILDATDPGKWMTSDFMPRTRDMSASRRTLLRAWLLKPPAERT